MTTLTVAVSTNILVDRQFPRLLWQLEPSSYEAYFIYKARNLLPFGFNASLFLAFIIILVIFDRPAREPPTFVELQLSF